MSLNILSPDDAATPVDLADLLTHKDEVVRMSARLIATGASDQLIEWYHAERERGGEPAVLIGILLRLQIQVVASIVGTIAVAGGDHHALKAYLGQVEGEFIPHCERVRALQQAKRGGRT